MLKACPKIVVRPAVAFPSSSWRAEREKKGLSKLVVCAQVKSGLALKICIPLISSTTKQIALTQWQTRTSGGMSEDEPALWSSARGQGGRK